MGVRDLLGRSNARRALTPALLVVMIVGAGYAAVAFFEQQMQLATLWEDGVLPSRGDRLAANAWPIAAVIAVLAAVALVVRAWRVRPRDPKGGEVAEPQGFTASIDQREGPPS